jgi:aspartate aminotransferase-like enzyme
MSNSKTNSTWRGTQHIKLFIPGPTEVRPEVLDAQTQWMVGHRMPECADLYGSIQGKIRQVFLTESRVFINAASGTALQEAAIRNCTDKKVLNCVNGAFANRWRQVTEANGKANEVLEVEWGQPVLAHQIVERLYDHTRVRDPRTATRLDPGVDPVADLLQ